MEPLRKFLNAVRHHGTAHGHLLGLLHILIGRRVTRSDGTPISGGMTWRELAALLKQLRWDRDTVRELQLDPAGLPPRDREHSGTRPSPTPAWLPPRPKRRATVLSDLSRRLGYVVGPAPGTAPPHPVRDGI